MGKSTRITSVAALIAVVAIAIGVVVVPADVNAATAVGTCTKAADLRYDCTKVLVVGDHIQLNANGGVCHANVTAVGTISPTLKSASLSINHNVTNCYWLPGTTVAIGYRVAGTPTPTGNPVSVGGIAGLLRGSGRDTPASASGGSGSGLPIALIAGAALAAIVVAGAIARVRAKAGVVRE